MDKKLVEKYQLMRSAEETEKSEEFFTKLNKSFPKIWKKENFPSGRIPVGNGWHRLLWFFTEDLQIINDSIKLVVAEDEMPYVESLKEKFGGLRIYINFEPKLLGPAISEKIHNLENSAERQSSSVCEVCSCGGERRYRYPDIDVSIGWIRTLCEDCWINHAEILAANRYTSGLKSTEAKQVRSWFHSRKKNFMNKVKEYVGNNNS